MYVNLNFPENFQLITNLPTSIAHMLTDFLSLWHDLCTHKYQNYVTNMYHPNSKKALLRKLFTIS